MKKTHLTEDMKLAQNTISKANLSEEDVAYFNSLSLEHKNEILQKAHEASVAIMEALPLETKAWILHGKMICEWMDNNPNQKVDSDTYHLLEKQANETYGIK